MDNLEDLINEMVTLIHDQHKNWWIDLDTGEYKERNTGELLMLCTSELAEAMEGDRKGLQDDHLTDEKMFDVELADAMIRLFDLAGGKKVNLGRCVRRKLEYNQHRADHKLEQRRAAGGKKY